MFKLIKEMASWLEASHVKSVTFLGILKISRDFGNDYKGTYDCIIAAALEIYIKSMADTINHVL